MSIRVKVDDRELRRFRAKFRRTPALLEALSVNVGEEFLGLVQDGFREERDPWGRGWKKPKAVPDGRPLLVGKTTRLRRSWHIERTARGVITIASGVVYAKYHQTGTRRMVARKMVPDDELPPAWNAALQETAQEVLSRHFR